MAKSAIILLVVFGISLFGVDFQVASLGSTVAVPDVVIGLLLLYSVFRIGRAKPDAISYATLLIAVVLFLSGVVNSSRDSTFDNTNFFANYFRILGLVAMVFLLPPLFTRIGHDRLAWSTMWVVRLQCVIILADAFSLWPHQLSPSFAAFDRPTGLFVEPGWFGVWLGLSVFYVVQVQRNLKQQFISPLDISLLGISVIASTGLRGIILVALAMIVLLVWMGMRARLRLVAGGLVSLMLLVPLTSVLPDTGLGSAWAYTTNKVATNLLPDPLSEGRIKGSLVLAAATLDKYPWVGIGLGKDNENRPTTTFFSPGLNNDNPLGTKIMATTFLLVGGVFAMGLFLFILFRMLVLADTRWIGLSLLVGGIGWGGAFESFIWWYIALGVALVGTSQVLSPQPVVRSAEGSPSQGMSPRPGEAVS